METGMNWLRASILGLLLAFSAGAQALTPDAKDFDARVQAVRGEIMVNPEQALAGAEALRRAQAGATDPDDLIRAATADWLKAEALISLNRPKEALAVINDALPNVRKYAEVSELHGKLVRARGGASALTGRVQDSLADYQEAFKTFGKIHDPRDQSIALLSIGAIYWDAGDFTTALKYERDSIDIYSSDPNLLLSAHNNSGNALFELGRYAEAEAEFQKALSAASQIGSPLLRVRILQNIARAQALSSKYDAADATLARGYQIAASGPAATWRPALDGVAALVAYRRHDLEKAATLITRAVDGARDAGAAMPMLDFQRTAYEIFRDRGDSSAALKHLEAFQQLDNQKRALAASTTAALMNAQFNFTNQELRINNLRNEQAVAQARFRSRMLLALLSAAAIISTLLLIGFLSIRRSRNQVRAANTTLSTTNVALEKALAAKTEFLATTSHEIRTPLNGILGMTQVILAGRALDPTLRGRIELVHGAGETMKALVDDILDVAKMETGELRIQTGEMDLKRLLEDAVTVWTGQAETKRIGIEFDLDDCPGKIIADEVRLRQIIFNLMSNAIKFTDRGHVRLAALSEEDEETGRETLVIRVADSGIGIPADRIEDIFESFRQVDGGVTRRHGGTGLGLAICRSLARAMGGDVEVASTLGAGSTFTLTLPLERGAAEIARADRPAATSLATAELLMIEPNPLGQGIMRALLAGECANVQFVIDVPAALEVLDKGGVDHVIAEGSALGLDPAAAGELAAACAAAQTRFTLLWREPTPELLVAFAEQGVTHVVAKPISAPDLLSEMNRVYGQPIASRNIAA
jgi:signal transduction histidine kinase/tetratricopeptide (TPR) repeat protein/CheY-like chemotaxis protein